MFRLQDIAVSTCGRDTCQMVVVMLSNYRYICQQICIRPTCEMCRSSKQIQTCNRIVKRCMFGNNIKEKNTVDFNVNIANVKATRFEHVHTIQNNNCSSDHETSQV